MKMTIRSKVLVGIAGSIAAYVLFAPTDPQTVDSAKTVDRMPAVRSPRHAETHGERALQALYRLAHRVSDGASANALFAAHSWYSPPPPPPPAPLASTAESLPPPVPTAPPLPFTYMGTFKPDGATPVFFLTEGDRVYDVHIGETLDNVYSVDGLSNGQLLLTYKPLNIKQQLSVGSSP
jgi:hypothetical protein